MTFSEIWMAWSNEGARMTATEDPLSIMKYRRADSLMIQRDR